MKGSQLSTVRFALLKRAFALKARFFGARGGFLGAEATSADEMTPECGHGNMAVC